MNILNHQQQPALCPLTTQQLDDLLAELLAKYPTEDNYSIGQIIHTSIGQIYRTYPRQCWLGTEPRIATVRTIAVKLLDTPKVIPVVEEPLDTKAQF